MILSPIHFALLWFLLLFCVLWACWESPVPDDDSSNDEVLLDTLRFVWKSWNDEHGCIHYEE
jgi:hypothetical protein